MPNSGRGPAGIKQAAFGRPLGGNPLWVLALGLSLEYRLLAFSSTCICIEFMHTNRQIDMLELAWI
jgi:hypothetical protein